MGGGEVAAAMAKHFVAVCVVCLLCADHLPCKAHFEALASEASGADQFRSSNGQFGGPFSVSAGRFDETKDVVAVGAGHHRHATTHTRRKRHTAHSHGGGVGVGAGDHHHEEAVTNENSRRYLEKIFDQFGDGTTKSMNLEGFESMLEHLGLTNLVAQQRQGTNQGVGESFGVQKTEDHRENANDSVSDFVLIIL